MAKAILSSWSCNPNKEPSTLYLHLAADPDQGPRSSKLATISISGDYGQALLPPELVGELAPFLESRECRVVGHNLLFSLGVIRALTGRRISYSNLWDTMLAWQMLRCGLPESVPSLQSISKELIGRRLDEPPRFQKLDVKPDPSLLDYAAKASAILEPVYEKEKDLIEKLGLRRTAYLEFAAIPALVEMEHNGMAFNRDGGNRLLEQLKRDKDALDDELQSLAKSLGIRGFNPRNPAHVKKALNELGYDVKNTSASVLDKIIREHPDERFAVQISKYRKIHLKQAILKNWLNYAEDGRIYPRLSQIGGRSGRITCSQPNIQQVPRDPELKSLFVAEPGMSLVEADYSAIEMRILAVLSGDETMLSIFKKGLDPHRETAQAIFKKAKITNEERQIAKTLNYGTIYGGGANMVKSMLPNLTDKDAQEFLYRFYRSYPGLKGWQQKVTFGAPTLTADGRSYKVSRSALGRLRYVDPDHRNALINTPVQSTAADLQKIALGRLYRELAKPEHTAFKLVNAVHDSILLEVPDQRTGEATRLIKKVMEEAGGEILKVVPCLTEVKVGKEWSFPKDKRGLSAFLRRVASGAIGRS
jgi:DNA polymerase-1